MEHEGSSPNLQELSTCSYPEPDQSSPHHPIPSLQEKKNLHGLSPRANYTDRATAISPRSILILSTHIGLGLPSGLFPTNNLYAFLFPHSCYMPRPSHPPRLDYSNYTCRRVQITKLLVMQFSPFSRHLIPPQSKYQYKSCYRRK
jgi:hypothetical protein